MSWTYCKKCGNAIMLDTREDIEATKLGLKQFCESCKAEEAEER